MSGPRSVPGANGSPSRTLSIRAAVRSTNASYSGRCTYARVAAVQSCPVLMSEPATAPWAAASMSASSKTRKGALPPSSRWIRFTVAVAISATRLPTAVEPVKEVMATSGWPTRCSPASFPVPVMMLMTPSGIPASVAACANRSEVSGVSSAGLSTIVLPAAIAGRIFQAAIWRG